VGSTSERDWFDWHRPYDEPGSPLAVRLGLVQGRLRHALDTAASGEIRVASLCAGQGRDVIGVLAEHPRREHVRARLVERDPRNTAVARQLAAAAGLGGHRGNVEVVTGDASVSDAYLGIAPADVVLACGIFGNVPETDIERTIGLLPMLCTTGATVIWTRHRREPDLTGTVRGWFAATGFEEVGFDAPGEHPFVGVGAHRWPGAPGVVRPGVGFFRFV